MAGVDLGPVTAGALILAALTFVVYRSAQRVRAGRALGRATPPAFPVLIAAYVGAWIVYVIVIVRALRGDL